MSQGNESMNSGRLKRRIIAAAACACLCAFAWAEPVKLIVDTDMYTDIDSGAVALAHVLADMGECELLGVVSSTGGGSPAAGMIQLVNAAYGRPDLPVGAPKRIFIGPENDKEAEKSPHYRQYVTAVKARPDIATYRRSDQAPDSVEVYRRILAAQPDRSVVICSIGFLTNMRLLLESKPDAISPLAGRELVAKKAKLLFAMACKYPNGREYNSATDAVSSAITFYAWPTPINFLDFDYGFGMKCGLPLARHPKVGYNPVYDIYKEAIEKNLWGKKDGHPAWDEVTVLFAVRGWERYCRGVRGRFDIVSNKGANRWTPDTNGPHLVVQEKMPRKEVCAEVDELLTHLPKRGLGAALAATAGADGRWRKDLAMTARAEIPRPEHPKPQFEREEWVNLNGDMWTFEFDFGKSGHEAGREFQKSQGFSRRINVPFCPESKLSGVGYTDFIPAMWYHRKLEIPSAWKGKRVILHFGGVDYECETYVNGRSAGFHFGGTVSFEVDLTPFAKPGETCDLVVRVADDTRSNVQPGGKQSGRYKSYGCSYTRTTGIWQTVWLEAVAPQGLADCQIVPDLDNSRFVFTPSFRGDGTEANTLRVTLTDEKGGVVAGAEKRVVSGASVEVPLRDARTWSPEDPYLYGVKLEVADARGAVVDTVKSYAGLRKVHVADGKFFLNNKPRFLRLVLDQGFYPDGVWTAPSDADLRRDIELSMAAGFNGARLHQKVFEERFHYWADRLGYLTWGESASWGAPPNEPLAARNFLAEWAEIVRRDRNHPSILAWTPFNETWSKKDILEHQRTQNDAYFLCKAIDPTRPVNSSSGDIHAKTDIWTVHNYARAPKLDEINVPAGRVWTRDRKYDGIVSRVYEDQPYMIDEFGGLGWVPPERRHADNTWGYGKSIRTEKEFFDILRGEVDVILKGPRLWGYCYTQLTDVEQEQNGVYYYDRTPKFDVGKFKAVFGRDPERK